MWNILYNLDIIYNIVYITYIKWKKIKYFTDAFPDKWFILIMLILVKLTFFIKFLVYITDFCYHITKQIQFAP